MVLAAKGSAWGGMVIGLVAAGLFVVFSAYIVTLRVRGRRQSPSGNGEDRSDD
jgi:hypothetical protein